MCCSFTLSLLTSHLLPAPIHPHCQVRRGASYLGWNFEFLATSHEHDILSIKTFWLSLKDSASSYGTINCFKY